MKKGWEIKKLSDVVDKASSNISQNQLGNESGNYPIYGAGGFIKNISFYHREEDYISIVKDGAGIGRLGLQKARSSVIGTMQYILPKKGIDIKYLYYFLSGVDFLKYKNGSTIPHIYFKDYSEVPIYAPPLLEQKRIVAIIEEAFAAINKAKSNVEKNLQNAKELFESYLNSTFRNYDNTWIEKSIEEICIIKGGGTPSKNNLKFYNGTIPWATVRDMKFDIIQNTEHKISQEAVKQSSTNLIPSGNVVIATRVGLGKVCILHQDTAINQDLKAVIPNNNKVLSTTFLYRWFQSVAELIINEGTGATVQGVKLTFINSLKIPLPPLSTQNEITNQLDILLYKTKTLQSIYQQKINALEELKKSILEKAFKGELKTREAELQT